MNNLKNTIVRMAREHARRKPARGCEPSSSKLSSQLFRLFPILSVADGDTKRTFTYHADGQLASATVGGDHRAPRTAPQTETFHWDGLALIQRGDEQFVNEPHVGGGNPVASSKGTSYFNDALGTTVGSKSNGKYSAAALTAFGENHLTTQPPNHQTFFTGKPMVEGLGHAFWMRNYRANLAKWQTADPMGYPDGWNQLAYCGNEVTSVVDLWGCEKHDLDPKFAQYNPKGLDPLHTPVKGLYYKVEISATCSGDYDLVITHSISIADGSSTSFTAPMDHWQGGDLHIYDENATFSNFRWVEKNLKNTPHYIGTNTKKVTHSFDLELWCTVTADYMYKIKDSNGTDVWYEGVKGVWVIKLNTTPIAFSCQHSKE